MKTIALVSLALLAACSSDSAGTQDPVVTGGGRDAPAAEQPPPGQPCTATIEDEDIDCTMTATLAGATTSVHLVAGSDVDDVQFDFDLRFAGPPTASDPVEGVRGFMDLLVDPDHFTADCARMACTLRLSEVTPVAGSTPAAFTVHGALTAPLFNRAVGVTTVRVLF